MTLKVKENGTEIHNEVSFRHVEYLSMSCVQGIGMPRKHLNV